jgi:hypothetical protein
VLIKDNLVRRRNWRGSKLCVLCSHTETIRHLFFDCHFTKFLWRAVQVTFNIDVIFIYGAYVSWLGQWIRKST